MALQYSTPGVYIEELDAFPHSIVAVPTAIPAFIGYTQFAIDKNGNSLSGMPYLIQSQSDFETYFGTGYTTSFNGTQFKLDPTLFLNAAAIAAASGGTVAPSTTGTAATTATTPPVATTPPATTTTTPAATTTTTPAPTTTTTPAPTTTTTPATTTTATPAATGPASSSQAAKDTSAINRFYLYDSIRLFYANGGGQCYIVSVGDYSATVDATVLSGPLNLQTGSLLKVEDATMIVIPDAVSISITNSSNPYNSVYTAVLQHCNFMQSRMGIFDLIKHPDNPDDNALATTIAAFRDGIGLNFINYGAAYFPWLKTEVVSSSEIDFNNLTITPDKFGSTFTDGNVGAIYNNYQAASITVSRKKTTADGKNTTVADKQSAVNQAIQNLAKANAQGLAAAQDALTAANKDLVAAKYDYNLANNDYLASLNATNNSFQQALVASSQMYKQLMSNITDFLNLLPPSGAIAGIYTAVDNSRGVWKAPANWSINSVNAPSANFNRNMTDNLNVDAVSGKSINAIRSFPGIGTLVFGGRTLDGNSQDWRYINVRRTLIMMEQSIKLALRAYVFEPNDDTTWVTVKSMIVNFLTNLWKQGALAGVKPDDAFQVMCGLNVTMTAQDILDGYMRVTVKVAVVHPAEFIVLTFQQQLQTS